MQNLSEESVEDTTFFGLQSAGLEGQLFGIDLLDYGLYHPPNSHNSLISSN
ncbi:4826_t:CDS:2 [Entrophospora sp. SA101]|nr:4826_t:CDS:2 [Entrophospora sp. SA101]CAJ0842095.1 5559_t:CDS:2 [Entrophospora sp. SA101]